MPKTLDRPRPDALILTFSQWEKGRTEFLFSEEIPEVGWMGNRVGTWLHRFIGAISSGRYEECSTLRFFVSPWMTVNKSHLGQV